VEHPPAIFEGARSLHVLDCVFLDLVVGRFLFQDVDELQVGGVCTNGVYYWKGEFALSQVLAEALIRCVGR